MWSFTPKISGNTMIPRLGFSPAGCATHASIVVPSSTLISTCCEVMFDIAAERLSNSGSESGEFRDGGTILKCELFLRPEIPLILTPPTTNMMARFDSPKAIVTGGGCRAQAGELLVSLHAQRTLIVVDPFFASADFVSEIRATLLRTGVQSELFTDFQPDPTDQNVLAGAERFVRFGA